MEKIVIHDSDSKIYLYIETNFIWGYKISRNSIEKIDERIFDYFEILKLSQNITKLEKECIS